MYIIYIYLLYYIIYIYIFLYIYFKKKSPQTAMHRRFPYKWFTNGKKNLKNTTCNFPRLILSQLALFVFFSHSNPLLFFSHSSHFALICD